MRIDSHSNENYVFLNVDTGNGLDRIAVEQDDQAKKLIVGQRVFYEIRKIRRDWPFSVFQPGELK